MEVRDGRPEDRPWVEETLRRRWGSTVVVNHTGLYEAASLPSLVAEVDGEPEGLLTYEVADRRLQVVTLDALRESAGVGTVLVERISEVAKGLGCSTVWLTTSNDNLRALRFYQRRGFRMVAVHVGGLDDARLRKPSIPDVGRDGIPVHDEIELDLEVASVSEVVRGGPRGQVEGGEVVLVPVGESDKDVLARLLELYSHDFSPIRGLELGDDGTYGYRYLDVYFVEESRAAWFIRHRGRLAVFVMALRLPDGRHSVAEFFVVRVHRRLGVGRRAAAALFDQRPGRWELAYDMDNAEAAAFWPRVVGASARGVVDRRVEGPPERSVAQAVLRFSTGPASADV